MKSGARKPELVARVDEGFEDFAQPDAPRHRGSLQENIDYLWGFLDFMHSLTKIQASRTVPHVTRFDL